MQIDSDVLSLHGRPPLPSGAMSFATNMLRRSRQGWPFHLITKIETERGPEDRAAKNHGAGSPLRPREARRVRLHPDRHLAATRTAAPPRDEPGRASAREKTGGQRHGDEQSRDYAKRHGFVEPVLYEQALQEPADGDRPGKTQNEPMAR